MKDQERRGKEKGKSEFQPNMSTIFSPSVTNMVVVSVVKKGAHYL